MNHYPRHIGDWLRDTAHLSEVEECIYSRCIDQYYSREKPLPLDLGQCARLVRAASAAARKALATILPEFFTEGPDGWHQKRCDEEIRHYTERSESARHSVEARWGKRNANVDTNVLPTQYERNTNQNQEPEPVTKEVQEPLSSPTAPTTLRLVKSKVSRATRLPADWRLPDDWNRWACDAHGIDPQRAVRISLVFRDYWHSTTKNAARLDWFATWRNWIRKEVGDVA